MPPFSLSDAELDQVMSLAQAVPVEQRDGFLKAVADALSQYPECARGPGLIHREARLLQRYFVNAPATRVARFEGHPRGVAALKR
jgi:hypothetical protein